MCERRATGSYGVSAVPLGTDPVAAPTGSIRGDFALEVQNNIVHGSDSPESAAREIGLFFPAL